MAVCRFVAVRGVLGRARGARVVLVDGMARVVGSRACFSVLASTREGALAASVCIPVFLFREFFIQYNIKVVWVRMRLVNVTK